MLRALWTAATGMQACQFNLDTIANNLANVNTTSYKKQRAEFEDLLYETLRAPGTPIATGAPVPVGIQVGHGTAVLGTQKIFKEGPLIETTNPLDLAIGGDGFFKVLLPDGSIAYTRDGSFKIDAEGRIVLGEGYILEPEIIIPEDATKISITEDGTIFVVMSEDFREVLEVGKIELVKFINPAGLISIGKNLYKETQASGVPIVGEPAKGGFGRIYQGWLEGSNVDVVEEMTKLVVAQRSYEINSKSIQTADAMLGIIAGLIRR
jgi:flagellar basal-body rod protein FlgG